MISEPERESDAAAVSPPRVTTLERGVGRNQQPRAGHRVMARFRWA